MLTNTLLQAAMVWGLLGLTLVAFGVACIKWGVYTAGNRNYKPTIEF